MALAILISLRSKDPSTQVGAVLVKDRRIVGTGYNGYPSGCDESQFGWSRDIPKDGWLDTKYPYVIHAEVNALINTIAPTENCELFVTLYPCNECAKLLIQGGVKKITYLDHKYPDQDIFRASEKLLKVTGVETRHLQRSAINFDKIIGSFQAQKGEAGNS